MKDKEIVIPGLVLEGGAMRGMYTAGILDTFIMNNITSKKIVGVSAGALFGVNYLSKQIGRVIRYNKRFNKDKRYMGLLPLLLEGNIVSTKYAYYKVPHILDPFDDETYKASESEFYAVVTNIENGKGEYIRIKSVFDQMDVLRASGSMPYVSRPVILNGHKYLDGAIADSVPFEWMMNQGVDKVVVILTRDITYKKTSEKTLFLNKYNKKYPEFAKILLDRHNIYHAQLERLKELEKEGKVFVIRPSVPINISRTEKDPDKLQSVYELGKKDAIDIIRKLKEYLLK